MRLSAQDIKELEELAGRSTAGGNRWRALVAEVRAWRALGAQFLARGGVLVTIKCKRCGREPTREALVVVVDAVLEDKADLSTLELLFCYHCSPDEVEDPEGYAFGWD